MGHVRIPLFQQQNEESRLIECLRVVLAIIAGLLLLDTPVEAQHRLFIGIIGFSMYAGGLLWLSASGLPLPLFRILHWLDACWFLLLIGLSADAGVRYFLFLFFPVLFAAWRQGIGESTAISAVCSLAALVEFVFLAPGLSWARLLALPLSLLLTGPLVAILAHAEASTRQALTFAVTLLERVDVRRGLDSISPALVERIAQEFGAKGALMVILETGKPPKILCWEESECCCELSSSATPPLLEKIALLPKGLACTYVMRQPYWGAPSLQLVAINEETEFKNPECVAELATFLGCDALMSVPLLCRSSGNLRLLLLGEVGLLRTNDLGMLIQVAEQLTPFIENAILIENLSNEAVDEERSRIGRNLHDTAIQPYIGLKFAIEALVREAGTENRLAPDLARLLEMANEELASMRDVVGGLRGNSSLGGVLLRNAVQRQATRFSQLFGVQVDVSIDGILPVNRHLAGELFHLVAEGLSNVRRHTSAHRAWIFMNIQDTTLVLKICNERDEKVLPSPFLPRSLSERTAELGGDVRVEFDNCSTTVTVEIPIE
ncbi:sensor histidine kinase [Uliginosibacterium gangwonense]|uniref:sensor histidine kinase n=1 Tax=Uliginosibacterium gangwonense TaxID=392736 RepID=UPI00036015D4|nr:histidine kinase [Uliginosibacterium gangwonense]